MDDGPLSLSVYAVRRTGYAFAVGAVITLLLQIYWVSNDPEALRDERRLGAVFVLIGMVGTQGALLWMGVGDYAPLPPPEEDDKDAGTDDDRPARRTARALFMGIGTGAGFYFIGFTYLDWLRQHEDILPRTVVALQDLFPTPGQFWTFAAVTVVAGPICEEVFFRGALHGAFIRAGWPNLGALVTGTVFALCHYDRWWYLPPYALIGVALALLYEETRTLLAPITAHILYNGIVVHLALRGIG